MFGKKNPTNKLVIDSLLDAKTTIQGNVTFSTGMKIQGKVVGDVKGEHPTSVLVIGKDAVIEGAVEAANIFIDGTVTGPVKGSLMVVVHANGDITGDVHYGKIQMEEGSQIRGQLLPMPSVATERPTSAIVPVLKPNSFNPIPAV